MGKVGLNHVYLLEWPKRPGLVNLSDTCDITPLESQNLPDGTLPDRTLSEETSLVLNLIHTTPFSNMRKLRI